MNPQIRPGQCHMLKRPLPEAISKALVQVKRRDNEIPQEVVKMQCSFECYIFLHCGVLPLENPDAGTSKFLDHFLTDYQNIRLFLSALRLFRLLGPNPVLFLQG